jgi:hypothetical protein
LAGMLLTGSFQAAAQGDGAHGGQDAKQIVQEAVRSEMAAAKADNSLWRYLKSEDGGDVFVEVDTSQGSVQRHVEHNGHPASQTIVAADNAQIQRFIHDPSLQAKQHKDNAQDDRSAAELLKLMPQAFVWKVVSETPEEINLSYAPDPNFSPPDMEARVMGAMSGTLVIHKEGYRIQTFKGRLENDVNIGFGFLARIQAGSTFDIERRKVDATHWEIVETHVHVNGHALFFKTIGTQEDEVKTKFTPVPQSTTLEQAVKLLDEPLS